MTHLSALKLPRFKTQSFLFRRPASGEAAGTIFEPLESKLYPPQKFLKQLVVVSWRWRKICNFKARKF